MKTKQYVMGIVAAALMAAPVMANETTEDVVHPGVLSFESAGVLPKGLTPTVQVNLTAPLLQLGVSTIKEAGQQVSSQGGKQELAEETIRAVSDLIDKAGLHLLQVYIYNNIPKDRWVDVLKVTDTAVSGLQKEGWMPIVHIPQEHLCIVSKGQDDRIQGFTMMVAKNGDYFVLNLAADVDPVSLGTSLGTLIGKYSNGSLSMAQIMAITQNMKAAAGAPGAGMGANVTSPSAKTQ